MCTIFDKKKFDSKFVQNYLEIQQSLQKIDKV